jgi:hypothetical protein
MIDEREQLRIARELITQREFDAARRVLLGLPGNPTARKWLAKLDEIAPPPGAAGSSPSGAADAAGTQSARQEAGPTSSGQPPGGFAPIPGSPRSRRRAARRAPAIVGGGARYIISTALLILAVIMVVGFFVFTWMDLGISDVTAFQIWIGHDGNQPFTLDLSSMALGRTGFGYVRPVDRLLILVPIGALALAALAWMYASEALNPRVAVIVMTVLAALLLAFPYAWQEWSRDALAEDLDEQLFDELEFEANSEWEAELMEQFIVELMRQSFIQGLDETYSTDEQRILGWVAVGVCIFALVTELAAADPRDPDEFG